MTKILILGGIREAAKLAVELVENGHDVTTSLAGRTKEPSPIVGNVRVGGFGGAQGLADYINYENIEKLIDCTHPFAKQISENARAAAQITQVEFQVVIRPAWPEHPNDNWIKAPDLKTARDVIPTQARVLLALGRQYIDIFKSRDDVHFAVRMVDQPETFIPLPDYDLILGRPSLIMEDEIRVLTDHKITHIVCRNSGGKGAYAKIEAARHLKIPVIIISR